MGYISTYTMRIHTYLSIFIYTEIEREISADIETDVDADKVEVEMRQR